MSSQHASPNLYGPPISLEAAKKAAAAALAEARKNNWTMAVAIVDPGGHLVYYEKMDNTQIAGANISADKARSAATLSVLPKLCRICWPLAAPACASSACAVPFRLKAVFH